nr:serine/threonine-protein kinase [Mycobacterium sp. E2479]
MPLTAGQIFAGYTIIHLLGSGGMGEVYLVEHPRLPRRDALKVLPTDVSADPDYRARFNREAELASTLYHAHIVGVHDRGEEAGQLWISMDYVDGVDASHFLSSRYPAGMPFEQVNRIVTAVANALDYAHKRNLLHRDVKPANIMMTHLEDDGEQRILLTDFGIARSRDDISGLTATNFTVGTVAYAAPEQLMGQDLDGHADQYALAATTYHLLTGAQLFPHSNPAVVISHHLKATPPSIADKRPELAALEPVLAIALAKNPDDRFQHCRDFAHALTLARIRARSGDTSHHQAATQTAVGTEKPLTSAAPVAGPKNPVSSPNRNTGTKDPPASTPPLVGANNRSSVAAKAISGDTKEEQHVHGVFRRKRGGWLTVVLVSGVVVVLLVLAGVVYSSMSTSGRGGSSSGTTTFAPQPPTPSPTAAPPPPAPTRPAETDVRTTIAVVNGRPANGFHEVSNSNADTPLGCEKAAQAAVTANVYYCYPNSASADLCWSAPPTSMLCLNNPWDKELRRFPLSTLPLPPVQHGVDPWPYALELDDGARCRLLVGMRDVRPDGDIPEYDCGSGQSGFVVLMGRDSTNPINRSSAIWTVEAGPLFSVAKIYKVSTAWFAGAE